MKPKLLFLLLSFLFFVTTSCNNTRDYNQLIVGKWQFNPDGHYDIEQIVSPDKMNLEFRLDGTCKLHTVEGKYNIKGSKLFIEGNEYTITELTETHLVFQDENLHWIFKKK